MNVDRDSLQAYTFELPWSFAGSAQYRMGEKAIVNARSRVLHLVGRQRRNPGGRRRRGGQRAARVARRRDHHERDVARGSSRSGWACGLPSCPFPLAPGQQPSEFGVSTGTGIRFAKGHAALDLALERIWRKSDGGFSEDAWVFSFGLVLKP